MPLVHQEDSASGQPLVSDKTLYLCTCRQCASELAELKPSTDGQQQQGLYLNGVMYQRHQEEEKIIREQENDGLDKFGQGVPLAHAAKRGPAPEHPKSPKTQKSRPTPSPTQLLIENSQADLTYLASEIDHCVVNFSPHCRLAFSHNPLTKGEYIRRPIDQLTMVNHGPCSLDPQNPLNTGILDHETNLVFLILQLNAVRPHNSISVSERQMAMVERTLRELDRLDNYKEVEWNRQRSREPVISRENDDAKAFVDTTSYISTPYRHWDPILLSSYILVLLLHLIYGSSRDAASVLLAGLRLIVRLCMKLAPTAADKNIWEHIPKDPRTVIRSFDLDPRTRSFMCCPDCFALYTMPYPSKCPYRATKKSPPCGAKLWRSRVIHGKPHRYPVRTYLHQDLKEWMGRQLSRPGIENLLDVPRSTQSKTDKGDIWDAKTFTEFKGPDGKPFLEAPLGEGRYIFSLCVDGFNPFQTKAAKQTATVTGIYMVNLSLPPNLRYLPENMYLVGVIPGPSKPSLEQINHFLKLLVQDLLPFWNPGVFFSQTANYPEGRTVRLALVPLVCDLLAAKQIAGFGSHNSKFFCSYCLLQLDDIENLDRDTWEARTLDNHKKHAARWLAAETTQERATEFDSNGVRWTALLDLPYWNPIRDTVVESMHALYLGILKNHCREIWCMDIAYDEGEDSSAMKRHMLRPSADEMKKGMDAVMRGVRSSLESFRKPVLWHLCLDLDLRRAGTKRMLAKNLIKWHQKRDTSLERNTCGQGSSSSGQAGPSSDPSLEGTSSSLGGLMPEHRSLEGTSTNAVPPTPKSRTDEETAKLQLLSPLTASHNIFFYYNKPVIQQLCKFCELPINDTKEKLVSSILQWRKAKGYIDSFPTDTLESVNDHDLTAAERRLTDLSNGGRLEPSSLDPYTRKVHISLCKARGLSTAGSKIDMASRVIEWESANKGRNTNPRNSHPVPRPAAMQERVLGRQILNEVQKDMESMELPSWISLAPRNLGDKSHGKLTADQWRTACSINLPVTLIRLWGTKNDRRKEMLDNFMDLVTAVEIGCMLVTSDDHVEQYEHYMRRYLTKMKDLYKSAKILPNHHISLHLGDFLCDFGPVHAWRAFAFERYNYLLQQEKTNGKFGELELTYMNHTCRSANFRSLLTDTHVRDTVTDLIEVYESRSQADRRGTRLQDMLSWGDRKAVAKAPKHAMSTKLDDLTYQSLLSLLESNNRGFYVEGEQPRRGPKSLSQYAVQCSKLDVNGICYQPNSLSSSNSNILFRLPGRSDSAAGRIAQIFTHTRQYLGNQLQETFIAVSSLDELSAKEADFDMYRKYPLAGGRLTHDRYNPKLNIIRPSDIVCHFAKTVMRVSNIACIHVLPLNRIMKSAELPALQGETVEYM